MTRRRWGSACGRYIGFVVLLAVIQTVTGALGLSYKEAAREHVRLDLLHNINRTALVTSQGRVFDLTASWDKLQKSLKCCGVNNASDWHYSRRWPSQQFVPDSCCDPEHFSDVVSMGHCGKVDNSTILYQQVCICLTFFSCQQISMRISLTFPGLFRSFC
ncbi:hypothetical protein ANCCEY_12615 [Ancylostoma ceylanicum]|uniref:Tetraspanin family protein n=1 Tax=Ancylostoma ceylanicum TaxID=53326 RepID=A0A0D6L9C9_9BILA|nr:hypothetical protein ANCCEY_12615 [Ancylostoma ceylanicum]